MSDEKLIGKGLDKEKEVISRIREETDKLLSLDDNKFMKEILNRYYNYSCISIKNISKGEIAGYAILSGGNYYEIRNLYPGESQIIGRFEFAHVWFIRHIDPPIEVCNLSKVTYVDVNKTIPYGGSVPQQMLWIPPTFPNCFTYFLDTNQHLVLIPIIPQGKTIEEYRNIIKTIETYCN